MHARTDKIAIRTTKGGLAHARPNEPSYRLGTVIRFFFFVVWCHQVGLRRLGGHNFEHNQLIIASGIMRA